MKNDERPVVRSEESRKNRVAHENRHRPRRRRAFARFGAESATEVVINEARTVRRCVVVAQFTLSSASCRASAASIDDDNSSAEFRLHRLCLWMSLFRVALLIDTGRLEYDVFPFLIFSYGWPLAPHCSERASSPVNCLRSKIQFFLCAGTL